VSAQPATQQPGDPFAQPVAAANAYSPQVSTPSAPVPTLPVQPSFLEQAGYAPLDSSAVPAAQPAAAVAAPPAVVPQQLANTQPAQPFAPQQPGPATVQPLQADAWDQAAQEIAPFSDLTPPQNLWNQPVQPTSALPPVQESGWGAPAATPAAGTDGLESLFGGAPAGTAPVSTAPAGTVPAGPAGVAPVGTAPAAAPNAFTGEPAAGGAPSFPTADTTASPWGLVPSAPAPETATRRRNAEAAVAQTGGSSTFWVWLIAISPIIAAGAIGYVSASTGYTFNLSNWTTEAALAAPYLLVLLFALADRAGLQSLGHNEPRSPGWALLTAPVYLIQRAAETRREDGTGTMFTLVWFVSFLVAIGGFIGYGFLVGHALIPGLPA
jgi:hypothetical protein